MESIKHPPVAGKHMEKKAAATNSKPSWFNKHSLDFENARFGWMAILITIQSCLGAAACMYILKNGANIFELLICAVVTMGSNALFIALAKPKVCLVVFYTSIILNTFFLIQNI